MVLIPSLPRPPRGEGIAAVSGAAARYNLAGKFRVRLGKQDDSIFNDAKEEVRSLAESLGLEGVGMLRNAIVGPFDIRSNRAYARIGEFLNAGVDRVVVAAHSTKELLGMISETKYPPSRMLVEIIINSDDNVSQKEGVAWSHALHSDDTGDDAQSSLAEMVTDSNVAGIVITLIDSSDETQLENILELKKWLKTSTFDFEMIISAPGWKYASDRAWSRIASKNTHDSTEKKCSYLESLIGELHTLVSKDRGVDVELDDITTENSKTECAAAVSLARAFVSCLRSDRPDGLYPTVVCDVFGVALGLVYSNDESIAASFATGDATYWSRSRNSLWIKGKTSGATQKVRSIRFDCDCDALRFCVEQAGSPPSFCHRQCRTCWGEDDGIGHLFRTIEQRKAKAPQGSYTKRLFDDRALLRDKLLEESQELIEAVGESISGEGTTHHVAEETADLLYFALVACCAGGASLSAAVEVLAARSLKVKRRPGNAKRYRQDAAEEALRAIKYPEGTHSSE